MLLWHGRFCDLLKNKIEQLQARGCQDHSIGLVTNELCIVKLMLSPYVSTHRQSFPYLSTRCRCIHALANAIYDRSVSGAEGKRTRLGK
jgi:hypothetical protein